MNLIPFVAGSAVDAAAQIREQLGPEAVVVHVRPLPSSGLSRLWRKPRFEVLAYRPEPGASLSVAGNQVRSTDAVATLAPTTAESGLMASEAKGISLQAITSEAGWSISRVLEGAGFLPVNAHRVVDHIQRRHGVDGEIPSMPEQLEQARRALAELWRKPLAPLEGTLRPHLLVGPSGVGKTTCLCKWLTKLVLLEGKSVRVWRLDGATANTAESIDIYCEALGVPVERSWRVPTEPTDEVHFIDVPGVDWRDAAALQQLAQQTRNYLSPQVHVVLNGAYATDLLVAQVRAFGVFPVEDLLITHLDEETRWAKLWNLALGTNFPIRFLSAGQNIPGEFHPATPDQLFSRSFSM